MPDLAAAAADLEDDEVTDFVRRCVEIVTPFETSACAGVRGEGPGAEHSFARSSISSLGNSKCGAAQLVDPALICTSCGSRKTLDGMEYDLVCWPCRHEEECRRRERGERARLLAERRYRELMATQRSQLISGKPNR